MFEGYVIKDGKKITNLDLTGSHGTYDINAKTGALSVKLAVDCANAYVGNNIVQIDTENSDVFLVNTADCVILKTVAVKKFCIYFVL